jgi:Tat protein translocase TatB subunit
MGFLGIGPWEILLILILALIVLGPGKLTDFARILGKTVRAIRKYSADLTTTVTRELDKAGEETAEKEKPGGKPSTTDERGSKAGTEPPDDRERRS